MALFTRLQVYNQLVDQGFLPILYHPEFETVKNAANACYAGGARLFEYTNRGDNAIAVFTGLVGDLKTIHPDLILGAGSILDPATAALFIASGANFIVGSVFNPEVARICNRHKVAYIPGCGSASEISAAEETGCEFVKLFPADVLGPGFVKALRGPTPWTRLLITGGVEPTRASLAAWFQSGAGAVGMGSNLFKPDLVAASRWGEISHTIAEVLGWIREVRA